MFIFVSLIAALLAACGGYQIALDDWSGALFVLASVFLGIKNYYDGSTDAYRKMTARNLSIMKARQAKKLRRRMRPKAGKGMASRTGPCAAWTI